MQRDYCVYVVTSPSGKMYIGLTNNLANRKRSHKWAMKNGERSKFYAAMRKYGDQLQWKIHTDGLTLDEAKKLEGIRKHGTDYMYFKMQCRCAVCCEYREERKLRNKLNARKRAMRSLVKQ